MATYQKPTLLSGNAIDSEAWVARLEEAIRRMFTGRALPQYAFDLFRRPALLRKLVRLTVDAKGAKREDRLAFALALHSLAESVEPTAHLSLVEMELAHAEADADEERTEAQCWAYPTEGNLARRRDSLFTEGSRALALAHRYDKEITRRARRADVRLVK